MVRRLRSFSKQPVVRSAFDWNSQISLVVITQTITDGDVENVRMPIKFLGIIQPLKTEEIMLKPIGQRSFKWLQIHVMNGSVELETNSRIEYLGESYKVMSSKDYSLNGYVEYHCVEDFENVD